MNKEKTFTMMVGNIGSGKSTIVKQLKDNIVVSKDVIRYMFGGGEYLFDVTIEPAIHTITYDIIKTLMDNNLSIVIDETNINSRIRREYIKLAKKNGYLVKCIVMPKLDMNESVSRRLSSPHGTYDKATWERVWTRFNNAYEAPTTEEGFDIIINI